MFVLNQVEERTPEVMVADFKRWQLSNANSVVAQNRANKPVLTSVGGNDGAKALAPLLPAPFFRPEWHLSDPVLSILGRHYLCLCIIFQSQPVSMATDRLKDERRTGGEVRVRSQGGGVCP